MSYSLSLPDLFSYLISTGGFSWPHIFTALFGAGSSTLPCSAKVGFCDLLLQGILFGTNWNTRNISRTLSEFSQSLTSGFHSLRILLRWKLSVFSSLCQLSIELSTALVSSFAAYASNVALNCTLGCIIILNWLLKGEDRNCATETRGDHLYQLHLVSVRTA